MAGDWIKTRVWLCRDPKVLRMADFLAQQRPFIDWLTNPVRASCRDTAYEHVTRNVTVALCVTGLVVTWGTARERGNREGDDLVLDCCELDEVSAVADVPCFGQAMAHVGWAIQRDDDCVVFPKFFKDQESPDDKHRRQAAERQARFRAANGNATVTHPSNVTVTHREEKRERRSTSLRSVGARRIPPDWKPSPADLAFAQTRLRPEAIPVQAEAFLNYWTGAVRNATSPDWSAKWRTWVGKSATEFGPLQPKGAAL